MKSIENKIVKEGKSTSLYCDASGYPDPTVTWSKVGGEAIIEGNWLNITNFNRSEAGQYKCQANNTCGPASILASIDVQCKNSLITFCFHHFFLIYHYTQISETLIIWLSELMKIKKKKSQIFFEQLFAAFTLSLMHFVYTKNSA